MIVDCLLLRLQIGCGIAGGEWAAYRRAIFAFAREQSDVDVHIVSFSDANASEKKILQPKNNPEIVSLISSPATQSIEPVTSSAISRGAAGVRPSALELARAGGMPLSPAANKPAGEWMERLKHVCFDRKVWLSEACSCLL